MRALKLIQHMKTNGGRMSEAMLQKIRASSRCREPLFKVPVEEHKQYALDIYSDLTAWLEAEIESSIENRCIANEHLWTYMQEECLFEEPVEFWGGVQLLRSLSQFFDRALYFASIGYQEASQKLTLEHHL